MEEIFGRVLLIRGEEKRENRNVCVLPFWGFLAFASCRWMFSLDVQFAKEKNVAVKPNGVVHQLVFSYYYFFFK